MAIKDFLMRPEKVSGVTEGGKMGQGGGTEWGKGGPKEDVVQNSKSRIALGKRPTSYDG